MRGRFSRPGVGFYVRVRSILCRRTGYPSTLCVSCGALRPCRRRRPLPFGAPLGGNRPRARHPLWKGLPRSPRAGRFFGRELVPGGCREFAAVRHVLIAFQRGEWHELPGAVGVGRCFMLPVSSDASFDVVQDGLPIRVFERVGRRRSLLARHAFMHDALLSVCCARAPLLSLAGWLPSAGNFCRISCGRLKRPVADCALPCRLPGRRTR